MKELAKGALDQADLNAKQKQKILKDVNDQIDEMKKFIPELGANLNYAFLTSKGQEAYLIEYGKFPGLPSPKPLTLLEHLGGSPVLAAVFRTDADLENYKKTAKVVEKMGAIWTRSPWTSFRHRSRTSTPRWSRPSCPGQRADHITKTMFYPALADGQSGIVFDAKLTSQQWHKEMPKLPTALPILEPAFLLGVSDADLFIKALTEYRKLLEDTMVEIRKQAPQAEIPEFKFPQPKVVKQGGNTLFAYSLPDELGLDKKLMPVIAVGKTVAAFTLSQEHAERLLAKKPLLHLKDSALANPNKPLLSASVFDWVGLLDAAEPWIEFGVKSAIIAETRPKGAPGQREQAEKMAKEIMSQVKTVLEVLKVYKGTTTAVYPEEGRVVTHSVSILRDLEK